jgi:RNA polymerase sigma-32 factor
MNFPFALPKPLPHAEQKELALLAKGGDLNAQDRLISSNLRLICYWASKYEKQYRGDPLELFSVASIGMIEGIKHFDPSRNPKFTVLAIYYMRRRLAKFVIDNMSQVKFATESRAFGNVFKIARLINSKPSITAEEIMEKTNVPKEYVTRIMTALRFKDGSLDKKLHNAGVASSNTEITCLKDLLVDESPLAETTLSENEQDEEQAILLHKAIETLPVFQQKVVRLYLLSDPKRTLPEVGKMLKCSREWVRKQAEEAKLAIKAFIEKEGQNG